MKMDTLKCCITVKGYKTIQANKNVTTTETNEGGKHTHTQQLFVCPLLTV